ncbi:cytochrome bd-I ubiquinol oxidase subunit 1 apoprotein [Haloactinospora alba]|uniref:Cytochrome bd-I ubiquinol oxidase subunit 1 apoprotein n=1 Tax=Haloactinospora alba TaxID=405555 RepID=A0A543NKR1_9ACTN|nr:cytochrome ubiquinol oxidase subunit I [Haloactinospora alba]TQN32455.1 cytochrome bd-I ubiquinol oxidase subunit 1 apoprotein [Haloactinospora alba]
MVDDPLLLARLQFALTAGTHYLFVAFTLGLAPFLLFGQLSATLRGDAGRMLGVRFWGGLYVVNYGMGVLSGIVMELQLATGWKGLNEVFGYTFGAPLAVETMGAFFLESTFLGLWVFGWDRMGRWTHLSCLAVVTATAYASAFWVLVANGFLRHPSGIRMQDGTAVLTNPAALLAFGHVTVSALLLGGLVTAAVSAYHLSRGHDPHGIYRRGVHSGLAVITAAALPTVALGGSQHVLDQRPPPASGLTYSATEIARIEDAYGATATAAVFGHLGYAVMVLSWLLVVGVAGVGAVVWLLGGLRRWRWFHWTLVFSPVLAFTASIGGWVYRETDRQPWAVTHLLTTADARTEMSAGAAAASALLFTLAFLVLATVTYRLLVRFARRGPYGGPLAPPTEHTEHTDGTQPPEPVL